MRRLLTIAGLVVAAMGPLAAQRDPHWAYQPLPHAVPLPVVERDAWCINGIDRFVLARLEAEGLEPAPPVQAPVWLRRVSLTLTGLPPTVAELDAFLADIAATTVAAARARAIDRLLASPRYGERMASEWLDVARYADTFGYQSDVERPTWPWRDWVVRALNDNLPFDQFGTWQIAGDLLPDATTEQRLATAFQRLHRQTNEGGSIEEEMRLEYVADRTQTFATAFLGMTMECARCHDHKFDPITSRDYYALSAFFDNIDECGLYSHFTRATPTPALSLPTPQQSQHEQRASERVEQLEREWLALCADDQAADYLAWRAAAAIEPRSPVASFSFESIAADRLANGIDEALPGKVVHGPRLLPGVRGRALVFDGENQAKFPKVADFDRHQPFSLAFWLKVPTVYERAVVLHRSKAWTDAGSRGYELLIERGELSFALVHFWPGNAIRVRTNGPIAVDRWQHVALTYDGSSRAAGMRIYNDGRPAAQRVVRDGLTRTIRGGGADALTLAARFRDRGLKGGAIDELVVFDRELTSTEVRILAGKPEASAKGDLRDLRRFYLRVVCERGRKKLDELATARRELGRIRDAQAEIMVMQEMADRRATYVRPRGSYLMQGERVEPSTPSCLPPLDPSAPRNRLTLARWLFAADHPLTARVAVNRIWQMHFGVGLVATAEDFGTQGERPSHPRLLDWLARWLVDSGWDQKALHRLIVSSATYAQSSAASAEGYGRDPDNRLLARGPRFRLAAEVLRDQALFAGGLLVEKLGGPPVRPYQPAGLWREKSGQVYRPSKGDGLWRRSLYTFWKRTSPPPTMMLLDASKRDVCAMRRQRTATPLQALVMMNDPQFVEAARCLGERALQQDGGDPERLAWMFRTLAGRRPDARECEVLHRALQTQRERFRAEPLHAQAMLAVGERAPAHDLDVGEVAAFAMVASILLNFDDVVRQR